MHKMIVAIVDHSLRDTLSEELRKEEIHFSYCDVKGVGRELHVSNRGVYGRVRIEVIAKDRDVEKVKGIIMEVVPKGVPGAGIIAVYNIDEFIDLSE